jgi:hypothetical protein
MRRLALAALLLACGAAVANLHVGRQSYTPVIRVASPDGLTYTALFEPRPDWYACAEASRRFLDPVKERCVACEVVFARCERTPGDLPLAEARGGYRLSAAGMQMLIDGPARRAKLSCDHIAADFSKRGVPSSSCASP